MKEVLNSSKEKFKRYALSGILIFVALNAFAGGFYGMTGAKGIPTEWLEKSSFHSYFIPSLILFICVGGSALFAAITVFIRHHLARQATFFCVAIIFIWLSAQIAIIGYVSWLQPFIAITAIIIFLLTWRIPKHGN